ncbi:glutamate decarboxylase [Streptomyces alkaliterrae]|uniref:Glutamate decarboxylase n=1 Tax=Streptomyces alkaliterrae TaxID=2213162 RepID=A0A5P0YYW5_9ACTN|nr:glutamate decarboxylase [Streptomyces alkaliterrae]MBB1254376.1 glutamate decarboxylase [Streptomyces alkaliterrae]MBB1258682.1 glutamate decarboxylase [Streptomyces alkaliterrae]MQS04752.1 glutamate decarboxylase [Streptomyces alkaliterrae]
MAVHRVDGRRDETLADVYGQAVSRRPLPKYRVPDDLSDPRAVYALVHDELALDGNASQNLATFCTTWAEPEVHKLMDECLGKNMIDKDEYPQTAEIESRCVHLIADLWHAPAGADTAGCSTTGSSEAGMLAGLALKWRWRQRRQAEGKPADRPNLVCGPVQVCWEKFGRYFDVELRQVPLEPDATGLRPHQLRAHVDENTIGVVAILGVTYTCDYEPIADLAAELDAIHADTGLDVPLHVDAASGGFVAPFLQPDLVWDFRIPRVASINASGHKYGMAPLGVGWVVWRTAELLPEELVFRVSYLGGDMPTFALNFTRPGGEVVAQYYTLLRLGRAGYRAVHAACRESARELGRQVADMGPFTLLYDGDRALPAVSWTLTDPPGAGFTLYDVTDRLRRRGWQVPAYPLPPDRAETVIQRVLVRHGISFDKIMLLADDLRAVVGELTRPGTPAPHSAFHH